MDQLIIMAIGLGILSVLSGMLGLGVAFSAVPFLSFFLPDLVHQVQPLSLILNGITALFALFGFAQSGFIEWKKALLLAVVTTISAPFGAWIVQYTPVAVVWMLYLAAVIYLSFRLFKPVQERVGKENFRLALILAVPISILSGLLGIGPGFLLMPTLILVGFPAKKAAGINAFAVTPPSFSALIPHVGKAVLDIQLTMILVVVGAVGSYLGARLTSLFIPNVRLKQAFGILIVIMTLYKAATFLA